MIRSIAFGIIFAILFGIGVTFVPQDNVADTTIDKHIHILSIFDIFPSNQLIADDDDDDDVTKKKSDPKKGTSDDDDDDDDCVPGKGPGTK